MKDYNIKDFLLLIFIKIRISRFLINLIIFLINTNKRNRLLIKYILNTSTRNIVFFLLKS